MNTLLIKNTTLSLTVGLSLLLSVISFSFNNFNSNGSKQASLEEEAVVAFCDPGSTTPDVLVTSFQNGSGQCCLKFTGPANTWFSAYWGEGVTTIFSGRRMDTTGYIEVCYGAFPNNTVCIITSGSGCGCFSVSC